MAIHVTVEVSERGLHAARDEIAAFLAHQPTQTRDAAHLAYAVLRKLAIQMDRTIEKQADERRAKAPKPIPLREEWRSAA